MINYKLKIENISKSFNQKIIFKNISFSAEIENSIALSGNNGSGKSTLLKILINYMPKSNGKINYTLNNEALNIDDLHNYYFLVAPYYNLYEEFSALENIKIALNFKNIKIDLKNIITTITKYGLENHINKDVYYFSSGMKQRLKYVICDLIRPPFIFIDEPTSNLDEIGKNIIYMFLEEIQKSSVLIFASNEKEELRFAKQIINLNEL